MNPIRDRQTLESLILPPVRGVAVFQAFVRQPVSRCRNIREDNTGDPLRRKRHEYDTAFFCPTSGFLRVGLSVSRKTLDSTTRLGDGCESVFLHTNHRNQLNR